MEAFNYMINKIYLNIIEKENINLELIALFVFEKRNLN